MMKNTLKIFAFVLGLGSLLIGSNSCSKDDAKVCCTWTSDGEKYKYCEGESYEGVKLTGEVWTYFKTYVKEYYNAVCK